MIVFIILFSVFICAGFFSWGYNVGMDKAIEKQKKLLENSPLVTIRKI